MKDTKCITMSIRVSNEEMRKIKEAAKILSYSTYTEFIRRTIIIEANRVTEEKNDRNKVDGGVQR
jgi:uncharacterized protein (DUF1778 family)